MGFVATFFFFLYMLLEGNNPIREEINLRRRNVIASVLSDALYYFCFLVLVDGI